MLSEIKRKQLNQNLPSGLFIDSDQKLRLKKTLGGKCWEKQFGPYEPGLVTMAEEFLSDLKKKARLQQLGLQLDPEILTLKQAVDLFWTHFASKKKGRDSRQYRRHLNTILKFFGADRPVHTITSQECKDFRVWCAERVTRFGKPVKSSTVNRDHTALIALFHKLDLWQQDGFKIGEHVKLPKRNPAKYVAKAGESESSVRAPTLQEFQSLLINAADKGMRRIILGAGIMMRRKKELLEMRKSVNVNVTIGTVKGKVSKRKDEDVDRSYTVVITPTIQMLIDTAPSDYIFNFSNFPKRWERTLFRAGLRKKTGMIEKKGKMVPVYVNGVQFRALRKLGGTLLNLEQTDPRTIQEMLRHSSLEMSQKYIGAVPAAMRVAQGRLDDKVAWTQKVDDSVDYTPRFKTPRYQNRLEKQHVPASAMN